MDTATTPEHATILPRDAQRVVEMLAFPAVQILDVTGPMQVFATANEQVVERGGAAPYALRVVAAEPLGVRSSAGLGILTEALPRTGTPPDTLIVAGGPGVERAAADPALLDWLRERASGARRTASVCTGALLLAATGRLDGRRAVTHWSFCDTLQTRFPAIRVERDPIFVCDRGVWSSAGVSAGIDLALALVEEDHGRELALAVARYLVMFLKRPGGQAQFSAALSLQAADTPFAALQEWIAANLHRPLSLPALAERAGMSERSFSRRYLAELGETPARAVERLRVEAARRLLADTSHSAKAIARRCGFGTEETLRRAFARHLDTTPAEYRARFGG